VSAHAHFRQAAVVAVVAWVAGECWAAPWNPVFWPTTYWSILLGVFVFLFGLGVNRRTASIAIDLSLLTIVAAIAAAFAWNLWMMHGWFHWKWLHWLSSATHSDGEGAYRMIEYQFFLVMFVAALVMWLTWRRKNSIH